MKKIISLLLVLLLCVGLLSTAAFAEEEMYDVIKFNESTSAVSENGLFTLETDWVDPDGWYGGRLGMCLTIKAADGLLITQIKAVLGYFDYCYGNVGISDGKKQENEEWKNGKAVTVININNSEFSFAGKGENAYAQFKDIEVYYKCATHDYDENNVCRICKTTKCEVEGHSLENGFCKFCDFFDATEHEHIFDDNNNCACGVTKCEVKGHDYEKGVCTVCQHECENEFHNGVYVCPDCYMEFDPTQGNPLVSGSTLSQGNVAIICSVAGVAIGLVGGLLIGKKKKPAAANGANSGDEE